MSDLLTLSTVVAIFPRLVKSDTDYLYAAWQGGPNSEGGCSATALKLVGSVCGGILCEWISLIAIIELSLSGLHLKLRNRRMTAIGELFAFNATLIENESPLSFLSITRRSS